MPEPSNAELTRRGFELWNERRFDAVLELFHEDAQWDMTPFEVPDMAAFRGHDGLRRFFGDWLETFPDATIEVEGVEQLGDWTLSLVHQRVSGAASGIPASFRYGGVGHWRDGKLDFVQNYPDLDRAREAFERYASKAAAHP